MDAVEDFVRRTLPKLTDSEVANVLKTFEDLGVETVADISRTKESELSGCLKPVQIRKLIEQSGEKAALPDASMKTATASAGCAASQPTVVAPDNFQTMTPCVTSPGSNYTTWTYGPGGCAQQGVPQQRRTGGG